MKHITSFLLAVALLVSSITLMPSNNVKAARNAEQWKSSAIVSPEEGKLIGAGYIDVKWNNDLEILVFLNLCSLDCALLHLL